MTWWMWVLVGAVAGALGAAPVAWRMGWRAAWRWHIVGIEIDATK